MIPALLLVLSVVVYRVTTGLLIHSGASWLSNFAPLAAKWDGTNWALTATPPSLGTGSNQLEGVVDVAAGNAYAVGYSEPAMVPYAPR